VTGFPPSARLFTRVRFVLVEPTLAANIGAAARAIKTMGFSRLVVVAPRDPDFRQDADAIARSTGAADLLAASETVAISRRRLGRDIGDRDDGLRPRVRAQAAGPAQRRAAARRRVAGNARGTSPSSLARTQRPVQCGPHALPAELRDTGQSGICVAELAQSVQVAAYECQLALRATTASNRSSSAFTPRTRPPASMRWKSSTWSLSGRQRLSGSMIQLNEDLMPRLRRLLGRARPTQTEVDLLRGVLAAVIESRADRAGRKRRT